VAEPVNHPSPLRADQLTRRYLRLRDAEPPRACEGAADEPCADFYEHATAIDRHLERIWTEVQAVVVASTPDARARRETSSAPDDTVEPRWSNGDLPAALVDHLERAFSPPTCEQYLDELRGAGALDELRDAASRHPGIARWVAQHPGATVMALLLAPFWVRPLATLSPPTNDDPNEVTTAMIDHLFARHPVPRPLIEPWRARSPELKWVCWTVLLGHGASLPHAAPRFGWRIEPRFTQHLHEAPAELGILDAVIWAEIHRLGGTPVEFERIRRHPAFRLDPTEDVRDDAEPPNGHPGALGIRDRGTDRDFWEATVCWLARHRDALFDLEFGFILDWAMHRHTEGRARAIAPSTRFTWSGRRPAATLERARRYRDRYFGAYRSGPPVSWASHGWDWDHASGPNAWSIHELTSDAELRAETAAMHHCVASYVAPCAEGRAAIFSLRLAGRRTLTVELDPETMCIVQARGVCNREATADERRTLELWLATLRRAARP